MVRILYGLALILTLASSKHALGQSTAAGQDFRQSAAALPANAAPNTLPEFEVATIKAVDPNFPVAMDLEVYPGGRVVIRGATLKSLITNAFHLGYWQIEGGEAWSEKEIYNIEAKAPVNAQPPEFNPRHTLFGVEDERLREMLQALLIDRFQLKFHRENRNGTVYMLEPSGKRLMLKPSDHNPPTGDPSSDSFGSIGWAERWVLSNITMGQLAKFAADYYLRRPVMDRTGLTGAYNYYGPHEDAIPGEGEPADSFANMIKDVGLKLTPAKGPVEIFVIDHAERPSSN